jgi:flagellin-like protein
MFDTDTEAQDRGQVGIGTLIVFIALVLVAAIAAGVLINTAGFLQTQAESTGQESTNQVSNTIQELSTTATSVDPNTDPATVSEVTIRVGLAPGADAIDLSLAEVQVIGPGGSDTVASGQFSGTLEATSDRQDLVLDFGTGGTLNLNAGSGTDGILNEGDTVEVRITVADGGTEFVEFTIPDPVGPNQNAISL